LERASEWGMAYLWVSVVEKLLDLVWETTKAEAKLRSIVGYRLRKLNQL
jgi:hypothetical protein